MKPTEASEILKAVKVHFIAGSSYDYFKYDGKLRKKKNQACEATPINWGMMKFCREFNETDFPYFCAWTIYKNPKIYVPRMLDKERVVSFRRWQERQTRRVELLKIELAGLNIIELGKRKGAEYPKLFSMIGTKIGSDTFIMLDTVLGITKYWDKIMKEEFSYMQWVGNLRKFRPFMYAYMPYDRNTYTDTINTLFKGVNNGKE